MLRICSWLVFLPVYFALKLLEIPGGEHRRRKIVWNTRTIPTTTTMASPDRIHYSPFLKDAENRFNADTTAMVVLNSPIRRPPSPLFDRLWERSSFRVCADGGANRLYKATKGSVITYRPDLITGDLDSLKNVARDYYDEMGVSIVKQYDQNYNDLDKSIRSIPDTYKTCFVYGAFGGRFDQEMASVQALFNYLDTVGQIWLFSDRNGAILLEPGEHYIHCPNFGDELHNPALGEGPTCGLIPIGHPCEEVTTTGLKWNLEANPLEFGGLVSTSNRIMESEVRITCSHPLLFTVEMEAGVEEEEFW